MLGLAPFYEFLQSMGSEDPVNMAQISLCLELGLLTEIGTVNVRYSRLATLRPRILPVHLVTDIQSFQDFTFSDSVTAKKLEKLRHHQP